MTTESEAGVSNAGFAGFALRMTLCHMVTYWIFGMAAFLLLDYKSLFESEGYALLMRPISSKWIAAGPLLQVIRGLIFALVLFPFRAVILQAPWGWLKMWGLLLGLAILSTAGPAPGSVEGFIYTTIPPLRQLMGLPEVVLQTLALSATLTGWYRKPHKAWAIVLGVIAVVLVLLSLAGVFLPRPDTFN